MRLMYKASISLLYYQLKRMIRISNYGTSLKTPRVIDYKPCFSAHVQREKKSPTTTSIAEQGEINQFLTYTNCSVMTTALKL